MVSYSDGDVLMREGELDSSFFIIALGAAEVQKHGKRLHQLDKGDCVGEIGFLVTTRRTATVTALGRVLALKVNASLLDQMRSEEHTSELQSLMRISYAVFCLKKNISDATHKQHGTQSPETVTTEVYKRLYQSI